jgi:hypothetical protein
MIKKIKSDKYEDVYTVGDFAHITVGKYTFVGNSYPSDFVSYNQTRKNTKRINDQIREIKEDIMFKDCAGSKDCEGVKYPKGTFYWSTTFRKIIFTDNKEQWSYYVYIKAKHLDYYDMIMLQECLKEIRGDD